MLRRFWRDRRGASEIVGTALFLVILFFFFTNVFLWHDQVTREMDQVVVDRMNSGVRLEAFVNDTSVWLEVVNVGGLDVTLSRLWIVNSTQSVDSENDHVYADFENHSIRVKAGSPERIMLSDVTLFDESTDDESDILVTNGENLIVNYTTPLGESVIFRVLTKRANTAACSLKLYTLTINTVGSGSVAKSPNQIKYNYGDVVELTANPVSGWSFAGWSGDVSGTGIMTTVEMLGDKTVTATFIPS